VDAAGLLNVGIETPCTLLGMESSRDTHKNLPAVDEEGGTLKVTAGFAREQEGGTHDLLVPARATFVSISILAAKPKRRGAEM
jgi:hypothetical protein